MKKEQENAKIAKLENFKGTMLKIVQTENENYFLGVANYRLSEVFTSKKELLNWYKDNEIDVLYNVISLVTKLVAEKGDENEK